MTNLCRPSCGKSFTDQVLAPGKNFYYLSEEVCQTDLSEESECLFQSSYVCIEKTDSDIHLSVIATPSLLRGKQSGDNDDELGLFTAGTPAWWLFIQGLLGAMNWLTRGLINGDKIKEWMLKRPKVHRAIVRGKHEKIFDELGFAKDFHDGVRGAQKMEYSKREALEHIFRYLFLTKKRIQSQDFRGVEGSKVRVFLTVEGLFKLVIDGYEPVAIDNAAERMADELKLSKIPEGVFEPIAEVTALVDGFNQSRDFYEAVYTARKLGHSHENALRHAVRYLFVIRKKMQNPDYQDRNAEWAKDFLNLEMLRVFADEMMYTPEEIMQTVEDVALRELNFERVPENIMKPVAELNGQLPPSTIERSLTDTQRLTLMRTDQKSAKEWNVVGEVISTILNQIKQQKGLPEGGVEARVGPYKFKLELIDMSVESTLPVSVEQGRAATYEYYIAELEGVLDVIRSGGPFTSRQTQIVDAIKSNPFIRKLVEVYTAPCETLIAGSEGYEALLNMARSDNGVSRALWLIKQTSHEPVGLIVPDMPFMDVHLKPPGISKGAQVNVVRPHYIGPYSFSKGKVYEVVGSEVKIHKAVIGWDQNGNRFYITDADFKMWQNLSTIVSNELAKNPELSSKRPSRIRAFFQFVNDLWVIRKGVYPGVCLPDGTPKSVNRRARAFRKINWGLRLLQTVDNVMLELRQLSPHIREVMGEAAVQKFMRESITAQVEKIREGFAERFDSKHLDKWVEVTENFSEALSVRDASKIAEARRNIESVVRKQVAAKVKRMRVADPYLVARKAGPRTIGFPKEFRAWKDEIIALEKAGVEDPISEFASKLISGRLSHRVSRFITARGIEIEKGETPSLERASEYEIAAIKEEGKSRIELVDKAFAEYERLIVDPKISSRARMMALTKMITLGIRYYKFHRVSAGLDAMSRMVGQGAELIPEASKLVSAMVEFQDRAFPIKVPYILREAAQVSKGAQRIDWNEVMARWNRLSAGGRQSVKAAIVEWKAVLPGSEYNEGHLKIVALCNEAELRELIDVFHSKNPMQAYKDLRPFHREVYPIVKRALVSDAVVAKQVTCPIRLQDVMKKVAARQEVVVDAEFKAAEVKMPVGMRIPYLSKTRNFISRTFGVAGPAIGGALTFLVSKDVVNFILPEPQYMLEAQAHGYSVLTTAMVADYGIHRGIDCLVNRANPYKPMVIPSGFSGWRFVGNLGVAVFTFKSLAGTLELLGVDPYWSEFGGLVGTGVVHGGWKPLVSNIYPQIIPEISRNPALVRAIESSGGKVYVSKLGSNVLAMEKYMNSAGIIFLISDATFGLVDAIVSDSSDALWAQVREEEYNLLMHNMKRSSYFADTAQMSGLEYLQYYDTPWYEKLGNSVNRLINTMVPAGFYKINRDVFGSEWREKRHAELKEQAYYNGPHNEALNKLWLTADGLHKWFNKKILREVWKQRPEPLQSILSEWKDIPKGAGRAEVYSKLVHWQDFASKKLRDADQNWIFANGLVNQGIFKDEDGLAFWMQKHFTLSLNSMEQYLEERLEVVEDPIERIELENALKTVHIYRADLGFMNLMYLSKGSGPNNPVALILQ